MHSDADIQKDILAELKWEPSLRNDDVGIAVRDGVVTLAGFVDSYADKWKAERVASRVKGVKAVNALEWNILVPHDRIKVKVEKGWVTLEGDVEWYYQKEEAERAVRSLTGVKGVSNLIMVRAQPAPSDVKRKIREALQRGAQFDADRITVETQGGRVILRGTVRSYAEMRDAERAARNAPGVTDVENRLTVDPSVYAAA